MPMPRRRHVPWCLSVLAVVLLTLPTARAADPPAYAGDVRPVLARNCFRCHGPDQQRSGLRLDLRDRALAGGDSGQPAIVPGDPEAGRLIPAVSGTDPHLSMPPGDDKLSADEVAMLTAWIAAGAAYDEPVEFGTDVEPILRQNCLPCHGPNLQSGGLRVDDLDSLLTGGDSGQPAVVRFDSEASRLMHLVLGHEPGKQMPPGGKLSDEAIATLKAWIDQGAPMTTAETPTRHDLWSLQPVRATEPPAVVDAAWGRNPIDRFVLARLEAEGLAPSPEADRATLIRRLSLDLLGLPPTPAAIDAFVADPVPDAYERLVDRLLASPHFGERWARHWLDLARYADSDGYEKDGVRPYAWRWRDWVIDAINRDLPFDRFTLEQLAGDLLPDAGLDQRVATGFHRNTLTNREGGVDPEEYRVAQVVDRTNTTGTVWLGLTVQCAQCHTHKYDPITQREYFQLYAFFNDADELDVKAPAAAELAEYEAAKAAFDRAHAELAARLAADSAAYERDELPARQAAWEADPAAWEPVWRVPPAATAEAAGPTVLAPEADGSWFAGQLTSDKDVYEVIAPSPPARVTGVRLEVLTDERLPSRGPGRAGNGNFVVNELELALLPPDGEPQPLPLATARADFSQDGYPVAEAVDGKPDTGWAVVPRTGQAHWATFGLAEPLDVPPGAKLRVRLHQQYGGAHVLGRFRLTFTDHSGPLDAPPLTADERAALETAPAERTPEQQALVAAAYRQRDPVLVDRDRQLAAHLAEAPAEPPTMAQALAQSAQPRDTTVLIRGDFLRPGAPVQPNVPAVLPPIKPRGDRADRLDLARWLVDANHPLTSRVEVNRVWQALFGRGLVRTPDDFGTRGEAPTHPELLDWLAAQFRGELGWSRKQLIRLIVTSATYRQSSDQRPELLARDADNRLLARQNRFRLSAEVVRDVYLAAGGLLTPTVGGPSVRPPLPAGVRELGYANSIPWPESQGADRYRRGLYIHFQRTVPYPMLMTFDAPDSNTTCTRRERSNTPLQALTTLNDPVFLECAQALGKRLAAVEGDPLERIGWGFALTVGRAPSADEAARVRELHAAMVAACADSAQRAAQVAGEPVPETDGPATAEAADAAAWVAVARVLLNLDECLTRG